MTDQLPNCIADLDRALNRLDFYRLFKALCVEYNIELLTIFDMNNWPEEETAESLMVVVNLPDQVNLDLDQVNVVSDNEIFTSLRHSMLHRSWSNEAVITHADFCGDVSHLCGITIPAHTPNGRHFGIWLMMKPEHMENSDVSNISVLCLKVFERFFDEILLPVSFPIISPRELEVIRWSSEGKTSVEIAIILGLSEHTINSYTTKILQKLQVVNRAQMVATAIRMGLIQ